MICVIFLYTGLNDAGGLLYLFPLGDVISKFRENGFSFYV